METVTVPVDLLKRAHQLICAGFHPASTGQAIALVILELERAINQPKADKAAT